MRPFLLSVGFVALLAAVTGADDAVEIKRPVLKAGDRYKVTKTEKTKTVEALEAGGNKTSKDKEETRFVVFAEEVVTPGTDAEKPTRLIRVYEKYELKGAKDGSMPPLNTPITIAKKGDKYAFTSEKPLGDFAKKLEDEFNKPDDPTTKDFLPEKPVKVGDSWKIDPAKFVKSLGQDKLDVDGAKSEMSGKLLKTYKKDGRLFGVLELKATFPLKGLGKDAPPLKSGTIKMDATADVCIDGTENAENTKLLLGFDVVIETKEVNLVLKSDGVLTTKKEPLPKK